MDAFKTHNKVISDYRSYLKSFLDIQDERIKSKVNQAFEGEGFLPEPLIQFNPEFETSKKLESLGVHSSLPKIFGDFELYQHQTEAIELGINEKGFVVTSGTGSGKSITYLATIFNDLLNQGSTKRPGVKAILVYPMNALINSQED